MRNENLWSPTKFESFGDGKWRADRKHVPMSSRLYVDTLAPAYNDAIRGYARGHLADLGCGLVPLYQMYRPLVDSIMCVDWASSLHRSPYVDVFADLNEVVDLGEVAFDTVIASDVIEHLHSPAALCQTASKALRTGGHFILGAPFMYWIHEAPYDFHRFTRHALERLLSDAGFAVVAVSPIGGAPEVISDLLVKSLSPWPWISKPLYGSTRAMLRLSIAKKLSAGTRDNMPSGYVAVGRKQ